MIRVHRYVLLLSLLLLIPIGALAQSEACCTGLRGNVDGDSSDEINVADLTFLVSYLFTGGVIPQCPAEADMDANAEINVADLTYLVGYLFTGGGEPLVCPEDVVEDVIFALAIGNVCYSTVTEYNQSGSVIDIRPISTSVVGDTSLGDSLWRVVVNDSPGSSDTTCWVNRDDGTWSWTDTSATHEALALKYPSTPGESYPYYDVTITVESINAVVTVPAGEFICYHYRIHVPLLGTLGNIWSAPNLGPVKTEIYTPWLFGSWLTLLTELDYCDLVSP